MRLPQLAISCCLIFGAAASLEAIAGPEDPAEGGQWSEVLAWPHIAVSAANLPDGRVLTWSGSERGTWPTTEQTYSATWNPATGEFVEILHSTHNMFCAHLAMLEDGRVFVNGGRNVGNSPWTSLFDFRDNQWTQIESMPGGGRWYPTTVALSDGDIFTAVGTAITRRYPERWDPMSGWQIQNGIDFNDMVIDDFYSSGTHAESLWWPLLHVAPNGELFHSGPTPKMHYIDPDGNGSYAQVGPSFTNWYPKHGVTIMYDEGKLLTAGGWVSGTNSSSTNRVLTVDLNGPAPVLEEVFAMNHPRKFHTGVVLPTGEVLVVGGNTSGHKFSDDGSILATEIWNPDTHLWRTAASITIPRNYHSVALLLTDGRVLAAGGGYCGDSAECNGASHMDGQVYSPSYLFDANGDPAPRPSIQSGPGFISAGQVFNVQASTGIQKFSLIKMSSVTHQINTDVRFVQVSSVEVASGSYELTANSNPNVLTPGYWMLFAIDPNGIPSVAHVLQVRTGGLPWLVAAPDQFAIDGSPASLQLVAGDADGDTLVYGATGLPPGLAVASTSGLISGTPTTAGVYAVTATVDDQVNGTASASFEWTVTSGSLPWLTTPAEQATLLDTAASLQLAAGDADGDTLVYSATGLPPGLAVEATSGLIGGTPTTAGVYAVTATVDDQVNGITSASFGWVVSPPPGVGPVIAKGTVSAVGSDWVTVDLPTSFSDMVVIATPQYDGAALPAVTRIRNAAGAQFELRVQNPADTPLSGYTVHYFVIEAGVYDVGGMRLEAGKFSSTVTSNNTAWAGEVQSYQQPYLNPVVVGQVMTANDDGWSVFWASNGSRGEPPTADLLYMGKHVGEDNDAARDDEVLGYVVVEAGSGVLGGYVYEAALSADIVREVTRPDAPYSFALAADAGTAVVSSAAMDGGDGGWPLLYGADPLSAATIAVAYDEDQIKDSERIHATEQVAYVAFSADAIDPRLPWITTPEDQSASVNLVASLQLVAGDINGDALTYSATGLPPGLAVASTSGLISGTPTTAGVYAVTATVDDQVTGTASASFEWTVISGELPWLTTPAEQATLLDTAASLQLAAGDADGDTLVYSATGLPPGLAVEATSGLIGGTPTTAGVYAVTATVDDQVNGITSASFGWVVSPPPGVGPVIAKGTVSAVGSDWVTVDLPTSFSDMVVIATPQYDGAALPAVTRIRNAAGAQFELRVQNPADTPLSGYTVHYFVIEAGVYDVGGMRLEAGKFSSTVTSNNTAWAGEVQSYQQPYLNPVVVGQVMTANDDGWSVFWASNGSRGEPPTADLLYMGKHVGEDNDAARDDEVLGYVVVEAGSGVLGGYVYEAALSADIVREVTRPDAPYSFALAADAGTAVVSSAAMDGGDGGWPLLYGADPLSAATIAVAYDEDQIKDSERIHATEQVAYVAFSADAIDPRLPWITTPEDQSASVNLVASLQLVAGDINGDALTYSATGLPPGLAVASTSGLISGTPTTAGVYAVTATVDDQVTGTASASFEWTVISGELPWLTTPAEQATLLDTAASLQLAAGDADGDTLVYSATGLPPGLAVEATSGLIGGTPTTAGVYAVTATVDDQVNGITSASFGWVVSPPPGVGPVIAKGTVSAVGSDWVTVDLPTSFSDMVVIATPQYDGAALPAVTRIRNAAGAQFELRVQNPADTPLSGYTVHYFVIEAGVYDVGGMRLEAGKFSSTVTSNNTAWAGEVQSYQQPYLNPVVVGQVMTANDDGWSVFWASNGSRGEPPTADLLYMGKHVGEDNDAARDDEVLGYVVVEAGSGVLGGYVYEAALSADIVREVTRPDAPYSFALAADAGTAVVSSAAMDGGDGGWPLLYGADPLSAATIAVAYDEDQIKDSERIHATEQVAYVAFSEYLVIPVETEPVEPGPAALGSNISFTINANADYLLYNWSFGDGTSETGFGSYATVEHSFVEPGRYVVLARIQDPGTGQEWTHAIKQLVHYPLTPNKPSVSSTIVSHQIQQQVWSVNPDNDSAAVIDATSNTLLAEVAVGDRPSSVAVAPDGSVWVVNKGSASISVIDSTLFDVVDTIPLTSASQPHGVVFSPSLPEAFVTLEATGELVKLDANSHGEMSRAYVGPNLRHLSVTADGSTVFVSQYVTPRLPDESTAAPIVEFGDQLYGAQVLIVAANDLAHDPFSGAIVLRHSNRLASEHTGPGIPNYLGPPVVSPDGLSAWVPSKQDNILAGALRGGEGMTFDQTVRAISSRINLPVSTEDFVSRIDHDNASIAAHAAFGPNGAYLFTSLEGNREVAISDAYTGTELFRFDVGRAPQGLAVSADGNTLYVHNFLDRSVSIHDVSEVTQNGVLAPNLITTIPTVTSEALAADVLVGKQLFYDARDPRLAGDRYMSCASCHNEGAHDGRIWDFTGVGEGLRNTITLEGRGGVAHGFLHWSANFDEVQDFEAQMRNFAGGTGLMSDEDFFAGARSEPLGDPKAGLSSDLDALAAYITSLNQAPDSPYRNADGTLTAEALIGKQVFNDTGCASCHTLPGYTDSSNGNLHDVGTLTPESGSRLGGPLAGIDTPTLLGIWQTAPYLHDGSAFDLTEAVQAHDGVALTATELEQVAAYLQQLDGATAGP